MRKLLLPSIKDFLLCFLLVVCWSKSSNALSSFQDSRLQDSVLKPVNDTLPSRIPANFKVLYGDQQRERLVQSVGYLNGKRLESSPVSLLSNAFAGHLAGLSSSQTNGAPRYDNPNLNLRGRSPLIVVDGVPRYNLINQATSETLYDILSLNPEQVESVTLLKDALSTSMLGNRGMDGVLMITTRKRSDERNSISVTAQAGVQTPIGMRKGLSAFDYATLYNEASLNSGGQPVFSQSQLNAYRSGSDQYAFPNVDWRSAVMKKNAPIQRYNLTAGGNYTNLKYFVSLDYLSQDGLLKEDDMNAYQTNVGLKRYILRSNIDLKIDDYLSANLNVQGSIQDFLQPGVGYNSVIASAMATPANAFPVRNFQGSFGGSRIYPNNPYAESVSTGYLKNNQQAALLDLSLKRDMDDLVKGSWLKVLLSYNPSYEHFSNRSKGYNAYNYPVTNDTVQYLRVKSISDQVNLNSVIERFQQTYVEASAGIDRSWNRNVFSGVALASYDNNQSNHLLNQIYQNLAARLAYSFDNRYNLEVSGSYSGNNRFASGNRYDFFPAAGVSWNIHNETFLKNNNLLNELKLRASYGKVGNADPGYYVYNQNYTGGPAYFFGTGATNSPSIGPGLLANPYRVTEKANKLNVGLDLAYSKQRGWLNVDYFNNKQYDLLQVRGNNSALFGQEYPLENLGINRYFGVEVNTGWSDRIAELGYFVSGNFSTLGSKVVFNDEPLQPLHYLNRTGYPVNQIRGYEAEGLFDSSNLTAPTIDGFTPSPGDAKYRDLNNDGVINALDQTVIGNNKPLLFYGLSAGISFKGFDLSVLFQGVANRDIMTLENQLFLNNGVGQVFETNQIRYSAQNTANATLPRPLLGNDINNYIPSSLFIENGNYLRLENFEIGYKFGSKFLSSAKIKGIRLFLNGQNLITFSKYKDADPEVYTNLYPLQRIVNGGLSIKL